MDKQFEFIENIHLIENNLNHIIYEFELETPSYFRIAIESHNLLLRTMVEVLRGTSNDIVTNKFSDKEKRMLFKVGNKPEVLIQKSAVNKCKKAWRFSAPQETKTNRMNNNLARDFENSDYLIGFYDLLAMIQCDYFMKYHTQAKTIKISDEELAGLEWLHEEIRNKYEHFVPKSFGAPIYDLLTLANICISICEEILVNPTNIYFIYNEGRFNTLINKIKQNINSSLKLYSA